VIFDARTIARGWLAAALASGKDSGRPSLDRTVYIESYAEGVRFVATDSITLLHVWVPDIEHELDPGPTLDEAPIKTAIAIDTHGRAKGFLQHLLKLAITAQEEDRDAVEVRLRLDVADRPAVQGQATFEGLEARFVVLEQPDVGDEAERIKLVTCEGVYPTWRTLLEQFTPELTTQLALAPKVVGQLAKIGQWYPRARLGWSFGGENKAARLTVIDSEPYVEGVVMPVRWDIDANAPRVDDVVAEAEGIARDAADAGGDDEEGSADA
jgi:hypothetical protein